MTSRFEPEDDGVIGRHTFTAALVCACGLGSAHSLDVYGVPIPQIVA